MNKCNNQIEKIERVEHSKRFISRINGPYKPVVSDSDRETWGKGVWDLEPDFEHWVDHHSGLPCMIKRQWNGTLCGYVGVPPTHPLYGLNQDRLYGHIDINVHGGLTYAGENVQYGYDGFWWYGFDCMHYRDAAPWDYGSDAGYYRNYENLYCSWRYVKNDVTSLAGELCW